MLSFPHLATTEEQIVNVLPLYGIFLPNVDYISMQTMKHHLIVTFRYFKSNPNTDTCTVIWKFQILPVIIKGESVFGIDKKNWEKKRNKNFWVRMISVGRLAKVKQTIFLFGPTLKNMFVSPFRPSISPMCR